MKRILALVLIFASAGCSQPSDVVYIGTASLPGDTSDLSGLKGEQSDGTPHDRFGGAGSAIAYTGKGNSYVLASDRGPKDGATDFACRVHTMDILVMPGSPWPVELKLTGTTLLMNEAGQTLLGSLKAGPLRFDPEGIRVGTEGNLFISDEYGPSVAEFDAKGKRLRSFAIPAKFLPSVESAKVEDEMPPKNLVGRVPNRGMEGLALSPDGRSLFGIMQSPLIQDGALDPTNQRIGTYNRIVELPVAGGAEREFVYVLDRPSNGVSEILAINDHEFLVLERDGKGGTAAEFKRLYKIDTTGATDVAGESPLGAFQAVRKEMYLDLLDRRWGLADDVPEKIEGLAFGPTLPDGRRLLLITADNDFVTEVPFRVYAFAVR